MNSEKISRPFAALLLHETNPHGPRHFHPPTDAEPLFLPPELYDWQKSPVV